MLKKQIKFIFAQKIQLRIKKMMKNRRKIQIKKQQHQEIHKIQDGNYYFQGLFLSIQIKIRTNKKIIKITIIIEPKVQEIVKNVFGSREQVV